MISLQLLVKSCSSIKFCHIFVRPQKTKLRRNIQQGSQNPSFLFDAGLNPTRMHSFGRIKQSAQFVFIDPSLLPMAHCANLNLFPAAVLCFSVIDSTAILNTPGQIST